MMFSCISLVISVFMISGCFDKSEKRRTLFFIETVGFKDSLEDFLSKNMFGKVIFYKDNKLEILSSNYITEEYPNMHYLEQFTTTPEGLIEGIKKIRIELKGVYPPDSITYSLQKYIYKEDKWKMISDMGVMKATTTFKKAKQFYINECGKQIINTVGAYTYE